MGDSKRFQTFATAISRVFPPHKYKKVADIAGGKGLLQQALHKIGYDVTTYDKRHDHIKSNTIKYKYGYFDSRIKDHFDMLVGMHPDEATDIIIHEAIVRNVPFCVVPCCVLPTVTEYHGNNDRSDMGAYRSWIAHLKRYATKNGYTVQETLLPIHGKNIALFGSKK